MYLFMVWWLEGTCEVVPETGILFPFLPLTLGKVKVKVAQSREVGSENPSLEYLLILIHVGKFDVIAEKQKRNKRYIKELLQTCESMLWLTLSESSHKVFPGCFPGVMCKYPHSWLSLEVRSVRRTQGFKNWLLTDTVLEKNGLNKAICFPKHKILNLKPCWGRSILVQL